MKYVFNIIFFFCLMPNNMGAENVANIFFEHKPQQINVQNSTYVNGKKPGDCTNCFGGELLECMKALNASAFRENLRRLNSEARKQLLLSMNINDYEDMLQRFSDEEWEAMTESLPSEHNEYLPGTKAEQMEILAETYFVFYEKVCRSYIPVLGGALNWFCRKDISKNELSLLKEKFKKWDVPYEAKFFYLNRVFQSKKEALFTKKVDC